MRLLLPVLMLSLYSCLPVFAAGDNPCAAMAGRFVCVDAYGDPTPVSFEFPSAAEVRMDDDLMAWNEWRPLTGSSDLTNRKGRPVCETEKMVIRFTADDLNSRGQVSGSLDWTVTWRRTKSGLAARSEGRLTPVTGPVQTFAGDFVCSPEGAVVAAADTCPDLRGTYICPLYSGNQVTTFTMGESGGQPVYFIDGYKILTDGKTYPLPPTGLFRNGVLSSRCEAGALVMDVDGDYFPQGKFSGRLRLTMKRSLGGGGDLELKNEGTLLLGEQRLPIRGTGSCARKN